MEDYGKYVDEVYDDIVDCVNEMKCQPIIFAGSGLSQRYFGGPSWVGLLEDMAEQCPTFEDDVGRLLQQGKSEAEVGTQIASSYAEWAWGDGEEEFPSEYRSPEYDEDIFLKYKISERLREMSPDTENPKYSEYEEEIDRLHEIQPHSIITTNYDQYLEKIFPDYEPIIGEEILTSDYENIGEILKIHGCSSKPESLRLTSEDYGEFSDKKKYLSAKLLTYFAEHPVLIVGYSATDENVRQILSDIDEILAENGESVNNIYLVDWEDDISQAERFSKRERITTGPEEYIEVNQVTASDFDWVYDAFGKGGNIEGVNLKLLRSVLANTYDIVRTEAPREEVEINYQSLERAANSEDHFGTLFGVSALDDAPDVNFIYRYRLTEVAEQLGYDTWHYANQHIEEIQEETGANIKQSDNKYHVDINYHSEDSTHRYSEAAVDLLRKVKEGEDWELDLDSPGE